MMKILYIHNSYHQTSGEEHASRKIASTLESHGHEVFWLTRTTLGADSLRDKFSAFIMGVYNPAIKCRLDEVLSVCSPDIVIVQNIYPYISSAIFDVLKQHNIPVVMRCPNYRLFCPTGLSLHPKGYVCEKCWGGHEWQCLINNCESSIFKSLGYALRNAYNRITKKIINGVDCFIVQSEFQKNKFVNQGIPANHIGIVPGSLPDIGELKDAPLGDKVIFVGRVSVEKGINEFIEAAKALPAIPFRVVGKIDDNYVVPINIPNNLEFVGFKKGDELNKEYLESRIVVVPSKWYEGFPNVILHAMLLKRPVITTKIGAMTSIVDDNVTGVLVNAGDSVTLEKEIRRMYNNPQQCNLFGLKGYEKAKMLYSQDNLYQNLMKVFNIAIDNNQN